MLQQVQLNIVPTFAMLGENDGSVIISNLNTSTTLGMHQPILLNGYCIIFHRNCQTGSCIFCVPLFNKTHNTFLDLLEVQKSVMCLLSRGNDRNSSNFISFNKKSLGNQAEVVKHRNNMNQSCKYIWLDSYLFFWCRHL